MLTVGMNAAAASLLAWPQLQRRLRLRKDRAQVCPGEQGEERWRDATLAKLNLRDAIEDISA
jgi:hypothetical protein